MHIKEIMTRDVEVVRPETTVAAAAARMAALNVGPLPVCDGERLLGMLTDRDLTTRAIAAGQDPHTATVRDAMTTEVVYCFEDQDVQEAAELMKTHKIRRLPVLNREKRLVGMVALADLAVKTGEEKTPAETLTEVSAPAHPQRSETHPGRPG